MVSLIGIAPAGQPADSAFRVGSEHEIPRTLTKIQPCTRLVERPADFRIKNTQRIEPVHRKTAKRIRTAHNGHIAQPLTQHLGSQHNSIAGSRTRRTYGRTENYIDPTGLQIVRHHRGNIPWRMHAQTSRVAASKVIAVLLPEDLAQIHSAHRSTGQKCAAELFQSVCLATTADEIRQCLVHSLESEQSRATCNFLPVNV